MRYALPTLLALVLAACTTGETLQPSATPSPSAVTAPAPISGPVALRIGELSGLSPTRSDQLKKALETRAPERNFTLPRDSREAINYTLSATISTSTLGNQTIVNHEWALTDLNGRLRHRVALTDAQLGTSVFPGEALTSETLDTMASQALDAMRLHLQSGG